MTRAISILCFLLSAFAVLAQPLPPETPQAFIASLTSFWPAPIAPKTISFTQPCSYTIQRSADLKTWDDTSIRPVVSFTATNNGASEFFRVVRNVALSWNPSQPAGEIDGYQFFVTNEEGTNGTTFTVGNVTNCTVPLPYRVSAFRAVGIHTNGSTSDLSDKIVVIF